MHQRKSRLSPRQQGALYQLVCRCFKDPAQRLESWGPASTQPRLFSCAREALDAGAFQHMRMRINHPEIFADKHKRINGIENFWKQAKRQAGKFKGLEKEGSCWFSKECEGRFNGGGRNGGGRNGGGRKKPLNQLNILL